MSGDNVLDVLRGLYYIVVMGVMVYVAWRVS